MTMTNRIFLILPIITLIVLISCGGDENKGTSDVQQYLPATVEKAKLTRSAEISVYDGKSLWEYIDGDAEIYILYGFRQVAATYYKNENTEIAVDLYRFKDSRHAYGLYSQLRPESDVTILDIGIEGFSTPGMINLVKGEYLMRLFGYDESMETSILMVNLAEILAQNIPGNASKPEEFALFPDSAKVVNTDDFYAQQFLGQKFLSEVYSCNYLFAGDTVTLFLAEDTSGGKFLKWQEYADKIRSKSPAPKEFPFDQGFAFVFSDNYYGDILVGLKNSRLIGMADYSPAHKDFLMAWIKNLP